MNWSQLQTVLWLRWRLTRNQWSRGGGLNAAVTIIATILGLVIAAAGGIGGFFLGAVGLAREGSHVLLLLWDIIIGLFLFFWLMGLLTEIQRSESIDLSRLLHLPVSLGGIFIVNYLASHLTLSIIVSLPAMLGLCLGLIWARGWSMALLIPLVLSLVFAVTAWTYCLRGWLIALMVNPTRGQSRTIVCFCRPFPRQLAHRGILLLTLWET